MRDSTSEDAEELIDAIRHNSSPDNIGMILRKNIASLRQRGQLLPVPIGDLQLAFSGLQMSPSTEEQESGRLEKQETELESDVVMQVEQASQATSKPGQAEEQVEQSLQGQLKTYQRWIHLFGTWPDVAADRKLEKPIDVDDQEATEQGTQWDQGLWRKMSQLGLSGLEGSQTTHQAAEQIQQHARQDWHPALQIQTASSEKAFEQPINLSPVDRARLREAAQLIAAQGSEASGDWVEIVQMIPTVAEGSSSIGEGDSSTEPSYTFHHARYPPHTIQTAVFNENSALSRVVTDYREAARDTIANGMAPIDILGDTGINVELFWRDRASQDKYTVCNWASEFWRSFDDWDVFVRLAIWMLVPTAKRYADVPDILKPQPIQRIVSHHIFIDFLPLPEVREALIKDMRDFMTALPAANLSVNWTGPLQTAIIRDKAVGCLRLTEEFEKHVVDLDNWSIGESILQEFPELQGKIRLDAAY